MHIKFKWLAIFEFTVILFLLAVLLFHKSSSVTGNAQQQAQQNNTGLLSARVYAGILQPKSLLIVNFEPLREKLHEYITNRNLSISVYVVNLRDGADMGINENKGFPPASLNKIPVAILILKKIEKGELSFNTMLDIKDSDRSDAFGTLYRTKEKKLQVRALFEYMLNESDDTAFYVLKNQIDQNDLKFLLSYLDYHSKNMILPKDANYDYAKLEYVTPNSIYNVFSSLYFSTLLKANDSEYILSLLTNTVFDIRKIAGLPDDVRIAQKFGAEYAGNTKYFHSCGIMYIQSSRIFYCIMTENLEQKDAVAAFNYVVDLTYKYVVDIRKELEEYKG